MIENINEESFDQFIQEDFVLVDFYATWCGPCKMLAPVIEEVVKENNIKCAKIDVDESDIARRYGIMTIPTLMIFKNGEQVSSKTGYTSKTDLEKWIEEQK